MVNIISHPRKQLFLLQTTQYLPDPTIFSRVLDHSGRQPMLHLGRIDTKICRVHGVDQ